MGTALLFTMRIAHQKHDVHHPHRFALHSCPLCLSACPSYSEDGLKYFDAVEGTGGTAVSGSKVSVHFEVNYRKLVVASSRASKLLGGNRTIAEVRGG